jgi:hypothetical protein
MKPKIGEVYHFCVEKDDKTGMWWSFYLRVTMIWGDFISYLKEDGRRQDMDLDLFCKYMKWGQMIKITDTVLLAKLCLLGVVR